jgi:hypothetical protein
VRLSDWSQAPSLGDVKVVRRSREAPPLGHCDKRAQEAELETRVGRHTGILRFATGADNQRLWPDNRTALVLVSVPDTASGHAVRDGGLITGQQQYSARKVAEMLIEAFGV